MTAFAAFAFVCKAIGLSMLVCMVLALCFLNERRGWVMDDLDLTDRNAA